MIALSLPCAVGIVIPFPAHFEFVGGRINVVCYHFVAGVDTACKEDAWLSSVEIWSTEEEL